MLLPNRPNNKAATSKRPPPIESRVSTCRFCCATCTADPTILDKRKLIMDVNGIGDVITGGASGLGRATAESLIAAGAKVTIFDVNEEVGTQAAADMGCVFAKVDVTSEADVIAGLDKGAAENGVEARILVNCAGI